MELTFKIAIKSFLVAEIISLVALVITHIFTQNQFVRGDITGIVWGSTFIYCAFVIFKPK